MWHMEDFAQRAICLLVGYGFGCLLTAELVARVAAGKSPRQIGTGNPGMANLFLNVGKGAGMAVLAGDVLKTVAACAVCYYAAAPRLGRAAILYGGMGAVLGHNFPFWSRCKGGKGVAVTCAWLILYLPVTGALCCLAGGALVLWSGFLPLGAVAIPFLAVPVAFAQLGAEAALGTLAAALLMLNRHYRGLLRICRGREPRFFRRGK